MICCPFNLDSGGEILGISFLAGMGTQKEIRERKNEKVGGKKEVQGRLDERETEKRKS